jgi:hypothetical protein
MSIHQDKLVDDFLAKIESELEHKKKLNLSEKEQLETIIEVITNYLRYFAEVDVKEPKLIRGKHPHVIIDAPKTDVEDLISAVEKLFMELGIRFKRHRFQGSLSLLSAKNNTVPGLVYGRGYFLVTPSTKFKTTGSTLRIECLRENQVVKVLDGKLDNLTLVYWNGRGMSRMAFDPVCEDEKKKAIEYPDDQTGFVTLDLVARKKEKNIKAVGDFTLTLNDELILERITSLARG